MADSGAPPPVSAWLLDRAERARLRLVFGQPERITDEVVVRGLLNLAARSDLGSGRKVAVFRYASREAAEAYARHNRDRYGLRVVGPLDTVAGPVNVLDLGPSNG